MLQRFATGLSRVAWRARSRDVSRDLASQRRSLATVPRIAERGIWDSIIPRAVRERWNKPQGARPSQPKEWNPATFFIVIFMIIGSNAINLIAVRTAAQTFSRKTEARIALLKDAIERVHKGEDVDVKKMLGTGDEKEEQEWEAAMREIENAIKDSNEEEPEPQEDVQAAAQGANQPTRSKISSSTGQGESTTQPPAGTGRPDFY